jgi:hypothetical protein
MKTLRNEVETLSRSLSTWGLLGRGGSAAYAI